MTKEEMLTLKEGCLVQAKGTNFLGTKVDTLFIFERKNITDKGYRFGSWIYPYEWFRVPTKARVMKLIDKIRSDAEQQVKKYWVAYTNTDGAKLWK